MRPLSESTNLKSPKSKRKKMGARRPPRTPEVNRNLLIYFFFLPPFFDFLAAFFLVAIQVTSLPTAD
jgi:hypothetical protein